MRGELRVALHRRHLARPPAFVRNWELRRAAHRESWNDLERKSRHVVVVGDDADVRLELGDPFLGALEALKNGAPVGLGRLAVVPRRANGGDVRRGYAR